MTKPEKDTPERAAWREHFLSGECHPPDLALRPLTIESNVCGACGQTVTPA